MSKPRRALATKTSQNALPAGGAPSVPVPRKKQLNSSTAEDTEAAPKAKAKKGGLAELRRQVGQVAAARTAAARTVEPAAEVAKRAVADAPIVPSEKESKPSRAGPAAELRETTATRRKQHDVGLAATAPALPRSPRPAPKHTAAPEPSPVSKEAKQLDLPLPPPPPSPTNSDLTYASFDENDLDPEPFPPAQLPFEFLSPAREREPSFDAPAARGHADSPWPQLRSDRLEFDEPSEQLGADEEPEEPQWGDQGDGEGEMEEEDDPFLAPPAQQPRRPYQPRTQQHREASPARVPSVDYDYELEPQDLLAAFLSVDRAIKARPRRKDIDEDENDAPKGPPLSPAKDEEERGEALSSEKEENGSDDDFPDIDTVLAKAPKKRASGPAKGRAKADSPPNSAPSSSSSSSTEKAAPKARTIAGRRTSRATAAQVDSDDSSAPKAKKKPAAKSKAKGKGKGNERESLDAGPLDTEALLDLLPRRKRRAVVPAAEVEIEDLEDEEAELTDYEQNTALGKRKTASSSKKPAAAPKGKKAKPAASSQPKKSAPRKKATNKRSKVAVDEEPPDSEVERQREKRLREYKALADFKLGTETVI
ncbi:hypothetical protein RQP46_000394 [Phenoliferia psychrophenolica]